MKSLEVGTKIKDFSVTITDGANKKLSDLVGTKGLILYFYPKDDTPGCTVEACDFRDSLTVLRKLGYNIAGVSGDSTASHEKFTAKHKLNFPLIADVDHKLMMALGVYGEKKNYGKITQGIIRTTLVLDNQLKITHPYRNVKAKGHVQRVIGELTN